MTKFAPLAKHGVFRPGDEYPVLYRNRPQFFGELKYMIHDEEILDRDWTRYERGPYGGWDAAKGLAFFKRAVAGKEYFGYNTRTPQALNESFTYLLQCIIDQGTGLDEKGTPQVVHMYGFVRDRLKAISQEISIQAIWSDSRVTMLELSARFYILSLYLLCEVSEAAGFSKQQNNELLSGVLNTYFTMLTDIGGTVSFPHQPEMACYALMMQLQGRGTFSDVKLDLSKIPQSTVSTPEVRFAIDVCNAVMSCNYVNFFKLCRKATYLQGCLLHSITSNMRIEAMKRIHKTFRAPSRTDPLMSLQEFQQLFMFDTAADARFFCEKLHIDIKGGPGVENLHASADFSTPGAENANEIWALQKPTEKVMNPKRQYKDRHGNCCTFELRHLVQGLNVVYNSGDQESVFHILEEEQCIKDDLVAFYKNRNSISLDQWNQKAAHWRKLNPDDKKEIIDHQRGAVRERLLQQLIANAQYRQHCKGRVHTSIFATIPDPLKLDASVVLWPKEEPPPVLREPVEDPTTHKVIPASPLISAISDGVNNTRNVDSPHDTRKVILRIQPGASANGELSSTTNPPNPLQGKRRGGGHPQLPTPQLTPSSGEFSFAQAGGWGGAAASSSSSSSSPFPPSPAVSSVASDGTQAYEREHGALSLPLVGKPLGAPVNESDTIPITHSPGSTQMTTSEHGSSEITHEDGNNKGEDDLRSVAPMDHPVSITTTDTIAFDQDKEMSSIDDQLQAEVEKEENGNASLPPPESSYQRLRSYCGAFALHNKRVIQLLQQDHQSTTTTSTVVDPQTMVDPTHLPTPLARLLDKTYSKLIPTASTAVANADHSVSPVLLALYASNFTDAQIIKLVYNSTVHAVQDLISPFGSCNLVVSEQPNNRCAAAAAGGGGGSAGCHYSYVRPTKHTNYYVKIKPEIMDCLQHATIPIASSSSPSSISHVVADAANAVIECTAAINDHQTPSPPTAAATHRSLCNDLCHVLSTTLTTCGPDFWHLPMSDTQGAQYLQSKLSRAAVITTCLQAITTPICLLSMTLYCGLNERQLRNKFHSHLVKHLKLQIAHIPVNRTPTVLPCYIDYFHTHDNSSLGTKRNRPAGHEEEEQQAPVQKQMKHSPDVSTSSSTTPNLDAHASTEPAVPRHCWHKKRRLLRQHHVGLVVTATATTKYEQIRCTSKRRTLAIQQRTKQAAHNSLHDQMFTIAAEYTRKAATKQG